MVRISSTTDNERLGWASGHLRVAAGSQLAGLLGGETHAFGGPLSAVDLDDVGWSIDVRRHAART